MTYYNGLGASKYEPKRGTANGAYTGPELRKIGVNFLASTLFGVSPAVLARARDYCASKGFTESRYGTSWDDKCWDAEGLKSEAEVRTFIETLAEPPVVIEPTTPAIVVPSPPPPPPKKSNFLYWAGGAVILLLLLRK
jgi:hypothetical protein